MESKFIEKAACIALAAHDKQVRKDDKTPYIVHPFMVALKLTRHNFSEDVIAAALVHDVLEDSDMSAQHLSNELNEKVASIAGTLSEDKALPWEERKRAYIKAVEKAGEDTKAVSIADKIHNLESLLVSYEREGDKLWANFNRGKEEQLWFAEEMLKMFETTWSHPLVGEYKQRVEKFKAL